MNEDNQSMLNEIRKALSIDGVKEVRESRWRKKYEIFTEPNSLREIIKNLKNLGFDHFICIETIDWLKKEPFFELMYYIASIKNLGHMVIVRTKIPRNKPEIDSISDLYPIAYWQEVENFEFFGVKFRGHDRLRPWILEGNWEGPPPLRKDFDSVKYVLETYYGSRYERGDERSGKE